MGGVIHLTELGTPPGRGSCGTAAGVPGRRARPTRYRPCHGQPGRQRSGAESTVTVADDDADGLPSWIGAAERGDAVMIERGHGDCCVWLTVALRDQRRP